MKSKRMCDAALRVAKASICVSPCLLCFWNSAPETRPQDLFFFDLVNVSQNKKENLELLTETEVSERPATLFSIVSMRKNCFLHLKGFVLTKPTV